MPKTRPPTSGYARIAQEEEHNPTIYSDESDDDGPLKGPTTISSSLAQYAPIQPKRNIAMDPSASDHRRYGDRRRRVRSNSSGVDIKAINARLEKWADEIASKFKIGKRRGASEGQESLEIIHSVFQAPDGMRPTTAETLDSQYATLSTDRMTKAGFEEVVESVRVAIEMGMHPTMISQGSSGSYFARNTEGTIVGVFKPKDEEPYASRNPKWTKWLHRNLFPCFFGRACLIPNLSYVSEAAAYVLDDRLHTNLVPYTDIVHLSSKSFFYDFWDRRNFHRKRKPFPSKIGSFQVFLKGFKDANIFLRDNPWPDQQNSALRVNGSTRKKSRPWNETCRPSGATSDDEVSEDEHSEPSSEEAHQRKFFWTDALQTSFREELEKLVILDYIMRNTDRGLDNWMIKIDWETQRASIAAEPPHMNGSASEDPPPRPAQLPETGEGSSLEPPRVYSYRRQQPMDPVSRSATPVQSSGSAAVSIGAIDNSLSWPWKHPDAWRSFPFGWLFLPVSLIGQPFSQKTRDHFLPLLTSAKWWSDTQLALRKVFGQDSDFKERMFGRQIAVMKGQAWNVVETLKTPDHGPLELTRRSRVYVWDDLVDIPVAVPMRAPSNETRRKHADLRASIEEEEMDISAANASAPPLQHDLLGLHSPPSELPHPGRFDLSRTASATDVTESTDPLQRSVSSAQSVGRDQDRHGSRRPGPKRSRTRLSLDGPLHAPTHLNSHKRRFSLSHRTGNGAFLYDGDDLEGDLGYSAAEGLEKHQRKVIVERLETVRGRNPVFTWC